MASLNKVQLIGGLGRDPEVRYMPNGEAVANFSIATTESWKDKSGQRQEKTEWHNIVAYRRLAEIAGEYLKKGSQVYVEGRLQTREWEKDGVKRYSTEIIISEMQMLGSKAGNGGQATGTDGGSSKPQQSQQQARPMQQPAQAAGGGNGNFAHEEDWEANDIPFATQSMAHDVIIKRQQPHRKF